VSPLRPQLKPALPRVWRDATTLQIGADPRTAVVLRGLDPRSARIVEQLDGTRDLPFLRATATTLGLPPQRVDELLTLLDRAGVLDDATADHHALRALPLAERDRLAPDLAAASLVRGGRDGGVSALAGRRRRTVLVHGAGRVGAPVARLVAAAGVGTVAVVDPTPARATDIAPGGLARRDTGLRRETAAARLVIGLAPATRTQPRSTTPDLTVITGEAPGSLAASAAAARSGVPHLYAAVREGTGVVGPLVLPGRTSCRRCHDLHRRDRDPGWPAVAAQLHAVRRGGPAACDVVLAASVAALAALQVVAFLDGASQQPTLDGTLEVAQVDGRVRRRSWSLHPDCGCAWAEPVEEATSTVAAPGL
jgi:hypothetical protein